MEKNENENLNREFNEIYTRFNYLFSPNIKILNEFIKLIQEQIKGIKVIDQYSQLHYYFLNTIKTDFYAKFIKSSDDINFDKGTNNATIQSEITLFIKKNDLGDKKQYPILNRWSNGIITSPVVNAFELISKLNLNELKKNDYLNGYEYLFKMLLVNLEDYNNLKVILDEIKDKLKLKKQ